MRRAGTARGRARRDASDPLEAARLGRAFFERSTLAVARELIGARLVRRLRGETLVARIVETEAYRWDEPACHGFVNRERVLAGRPPVGRSALLFGAPGIAYVYLSYGVHWLFNVVTEDEGVGGAVLVRAVEPLAGLATMHALRPAERDPRRLGSGPGRLTRALDIGPRFNGHPLASSDELFLAASADPRPPRIARGPRIGIRRASELPWRFFERDHPSVSR